MQKIADKLWLYGSYGCFFLMSASFLIMPLDAYNENIKTSTLNMVSGLCFWVFLIIGCILQGVLAHYRKKWCSRYRMSKEVEKKSGRGVVSFFKNSSAIVADITFLLGIVCVAIAMVLTESKGYICYVFIAVTVFSFCMHCIFNGKNYYFVTNKEHMVNELKEKYKK